MKIRIALAALFCAFSAYAGDWQVDIAPSFGLKSGQLGEYVFLSDCSYSDDTLSYLQWNYKNPYIALKTDFAYKRLSLENSVYYGWGIFRGEMTDSDWQNVMYSNLSASQYKTNYSESDNFTKRDVGVSTKLSFAFLPLEFLKIKPFAAVDFSYMRFTARGGDYSYGKQYGNFFYAYDDDEHNYTGAFSGDVLYYRRWSLWTWLGAGIEAAGERLRSGFDLALSPYYFAADVDTHCLTGMRYVDMAEEAFAAWKIAYFIEAAVTKRSAIGFQISYLDTDVLRGKTYHKSISGGKYEQDSTSECGIDERSLNLSLYYRLRIFGLK